MHSFSTRNLYCSKLIIFKINIVEKIRLRGLQRPSLLTCLLSRDWSWLNIMRNMNKLNSTSLGGKLAVEGNMYQCCTMPLLVRRPAGNLLINWEYLLFFWIGHLNMHMYETCKGQRSCPVHIHDISPLNSADAAIQMTA